MDQHVNQLDRDSALSAPDARSEITLAVVTRNRSNEFAEFLLSGLLEVLAAGFHVVVVDQGDDDRTKRVVETLPGGVTYVRGGHGLAAGRNQALAFVGTQFVAFTDDDIVVTAGWLTSLAAILWKDRRIGAVCGRGRWTTGELMPGAPEDQYVYPTSPYRLGSGYNMAFRREALSATGPFDINFGPGARFGSADDIEMLYRLLREGWSVTCSDRPVVIHPEWRGRPAELWRQFRYGVGVGALAGKYRAKGDPYIMLYLRGRITRQTERLRGALRDRILSLIFIRAAFLIGLPIGLAWAYLGETTKNTRRQVYAGR